MPAKKKLAVVTGGAGFIGAAISTHLANTFERVVAFDNLHPQIHPDGKPSDGLDPRVELFKADVTNPAAWDSLLEHERPDVVVHLAAETGTGQSLTESTRHTSVNIVGTSTMLDAFQRNGKVPSRIVLASSRAVYGEGAWLHTGGPQAGSVFYPGARTLEMFQSAEWDFPNAEPLPMNAASVLARPSSIYGVTKLAQEDLLRIWGDAFGVEIGIVRLQNVYGPGQTPSNPYTGIMSLFCRVAHNGGQISVYEDGAVRRDFIIIDDVADSLIKMVEIDRCPTVPIDIGSGSFQTIQQAANLIAGIYSAPTPEVTGQWRHGDVRHAWADPAPARELLGFTARVSVEEGFNRLAQWIDTQREYL